MTAPACWSWAIPTRTREEEVEYLVAQNALLTNPDDRLDRGSIEMLVEDWSYHRLTVFHSDRCAVCGRTTGLGGLVDDHDHWTGLIRGLLCRSCNRREPYPQYAELFDLYRERPPTVILGVRRYYEGVTWPYGWWENEAWARLLTGNPEWTRVEETG